MNIDLTNLKELINERDEVVQRFSACIDELMSILAKTQVTLPRGFSLTYYPSKEYIFTLGNRNLTLTHCRKEVVVVEAFVQAIQTGWLDEVCKQVQKQTKVFELCLGKSNQALAKLKT